MDVCCLDLLLFILENKSLSDSKEIMGPTDALSTKSEMRAATTSTKVNVSLVTASSSIRTLLTIKTLENRRLCVVHAASCNLL